MKRRSRLFWSLYIQVLLRAASLVSRDGPSGQSRQRRPRRRVLGSDFSTTSHVFMNKSCWARTVPLYDDDDMAQTDDCNARDCEFIYICCIVWPIE